VQSGRVAALTAEHRRGHGAFNAGRIQIDRLRRELAGLPLPRDGAGRIVLGVDVSNWPRPDAATAPERSFCHVYGRGKSAAQLIPGWPYSFVAALEPGRTSWTAMLDVVRLGPLDDVTEVTAVQVRSVVARLCEAGQWTEGDPPILVVFDAGYDIVRLAWLLADVPVCVLGRLRSDRVFHLPCPPRLPGRVGRPGRHGPVIDLDEPATHPAAAVSTVTETSRYGKAFADAWDRAHQQLHRRAGWAGHEGQLPIVEGSLIRLMVDRLPGDRHPQPIWPAHSRQRAETHPARAGPPTRLPQQARRRSPTRRQNPTPEPDTQHQTPKKGFKNKAKACCIALARHRSPATTRSPIGNRLLKQAVA
jgi:hypothetical protein